MEINKTSKNILIIIALLFFLAIVLIGTGVFLLFSSKDERNNGDFEINYEKEKVINLSSVKKGTVYSNSIKVVNNTNESLVYSVSFVNVSNNFKEQNKLLYMLDTHDPDAFYIGKSQLPVADMTLSDSVKINPNTTHSYTFTIFFEGDTDKEKNSTFIGELDLKTV